MERMMTLYNPSIWSNELADGRRNYIKSILFDEKKPMRMVTLAKILGTIADEPVPERTSKDSRIFHASRYRRVLTDDIDALNRDPKFPYAIMSDSYGVRICTHEDVERMYATERREALKKLAKCSVIARKAGLDGQITITAEEIKAFIEGEENGHNL